MTKIKNIKATEILDSRGNPTVKVNIFLTDGQHTHAAVPSGASTGANEAEELRDGDKKRYGGKGVLKAVSNVNNIIAEKLVGVDPTKQEKIDDILLALDGTQNKSNLGANAILAVSEAVAKAGAKAKKVPLYKHLRDLSNQWGIETGEEYKLPLPLMNVINGGAHANNNLSFQEFLIIPMPQGRKAKNYSFSDALETGTEIYHKLGEILKANKKSIAVGDEGGYAPDFKANTEAIEFLIEAIKTCRLKPGGNVFLGLDVASTQLFNKGEYSLNGKHPYKTEKLIEYYSQLVAYYPIIYLEDPLEEESWSDWISLTEKIGDKILVCGDDLFTTQSNRLARGINELAANSLIIKPNQVGTVSETLTTIKLARETGFKIIISHRSGETLDAFISDLAVAVNAWGLKAGAPDRGERVAKYNRLLEIEAELNS